MFLADSMKAAVATERSTTKKFKRKRRLERTRRKQGREEGTLLELNMAGRKTPLNAQRCNGTKASEIIEKNPRPTFSFFFLFFFDAQCQRNGIRYPCFDFVFFLHPFACYLRTRILHNLDETGLEETVKRGRDNEGESVGKG